jgi:histidine triad (HIT) family protein
VSAFINSFWIKGNEGHVIVVPNEHYENIYEITEEVGTAIFTVSKKISIIMREAYHCDGITIRQNNEPAADQHALHYHQHIFPRYENDNFNHELCQKALLSNSKDRAVFANRLKSNI